MAAAHKAAELGSHYRLRITMPGKLTLNAFLLAALAVALALHTGAASAQAKPGASRSAEISAFGGFSYAKPDFGPDSIHNTGGIIGLNYTRFLLNFPIHPSLELRGTYNTGDAVTQSSVQAGLRGTYDFVDKGDFRDRLHPYFGVYGGEGVIKYNHYLGFPSDRGFVLGGALGINVDAYKHFQVMAEFELQNWNFGEDPPLKPNGSNFTLSPKVVSVGISYRVPARSRNLTSDNH